MTKNKMSIKELAKLYPEKLNKNKPTLKDMHEVGRNISMIKWNNFKTRILEKLKIIK